MRLRSRVPRKAWKVLWGLVISVLFLGTVVVPVLAEGEKKDVSEKILRDKRYYYKAFNRRDPFQSLIIGEFE